MILHLSANKSLLIPKKIRTCSSANEVALGDRILHTAHKSILLCQRNVDLELRKWCRAAGNMILHPSTTPIPKKCGPTAQQMEWHRGIGSPTLPINEFYYSKKMRTWSSANGVGQ